MAFECKKSCGECCGIIGIPIEIAKKTEKLAQIKPDQVVQMGDKLYILTPDGLCVYLNRKTKECAIYEDRPEICRIYGLIPTCPCPYFDINGKRRDKLESTIIQIQINQTVDRVIEMVKQNEKI